MTKMTKREKFEMLMNIPAVAENEILREFVQSQIDQLVKKASADKKPTKKQIENKAYAEEVTTFLSMNAGEKFTISDLVKEIADFGEFSTSKVSAILRVAMETADSPVIRVVEKRKPYFTVIMAEDEEVEDEGV